MSDKNSMENAKKLKKELEQVKKELERYQKNYSQDLNLRSIEDLSVGLIHEISNPLSILKSNLDVLKSEVEAKGVMDPKREHMFSIAQKGIHRMEEVAENLKRFLNGVNEDNSVDKKEFFEVDQIINEVISFCKSSLQAKGIELEAEASSGLKVKGDEGQFRQVLLNLVLNARDAMAVSEEKKLVIKAVADINHVLVLVSDTGPGIEPSKHEKVFESFYSTKSRGKGSGVGLSISKSFVEKMKGSISIESEVGHGATFVLKFPQYIEAETLSNEDKPSVFHGRALLVHPQKEVAHVLKRSFEQMGLDVEVHYEAMKARESLLSSEFDLYFTSYQLDNMNGLQFVNSLKDKIDTYSVLLFQKDVDSLPEKTLSEINDLVDTFLERPYSEEKISHIVATLKQKKLKTA